MYIVRERGIDDGNEKEVTEITAHRTQGTNRFLKLSRRKGALIQRDRRMDG